MTMLNAAVSDKEITDESLLNAEELAQVLNVSIKTVRKWRYTRELKAIKIGKRLVRFRWSDVKAWLSEEGGEE